MRNQIGGEKIREQRPGSGAHRSIGKPPRLSSIIFCFQFKITKEQTRVRRPSRYFLLLPKRRTAQVKTANTFIYYRIV